MNPSRPNLVSAGIALAIAAATWTVYWPVRQHGFVSYDDPEYVAGNQIVQSGLTWAGVKWAFTTGWTSYWHPLTWLSHMLDAQLFGPGPAGPHLVNVLFHSANAVLLFFFLRRTTNAVWPGAWVAVVFALHPLHVESVAWISERKDVLSAFFFLLTLWAYVNYAAPKPERAPGSRAWYTCALVLFALGLMCKPMLVTLPCVLLLLDYWPLGRTRSTALLVEKIPFFILSMLSCAVTFLVQKQNGAVQSLAQVSVGGRIENALAAYAQYLGKTFWPSRLAVFYPHPGSWPFAEVAVAAFIVVGASAAAFWLGRRFHFAAMGWLWFLGILVPAIGLVQVGDQAMADRYMYLPMIGVLVILAWSACEIVARRPQSRLFIGSAAALTAAACVVPTARQLNHWRDSESLFRHALDVTHENFVAHNNLGNALLEKGRLDEAVDHFESAIKLRPDYAPPQNNLGMLFLNTGRPAEAVPHLQKALELQPGFAEIHSNLGNALRQQGQVDAAIAHYNEAIKLRPTLAVAHFNLGSILLENGRPDLAIAPLRQAVTLEPGDVKAHADLGLALLQTGSSEEAAAQFAAVLKVQPDWIEVRYRLAAALFQSHRLGEAIVQFEAVAEAQPGNAEVLNNLGWALLQTRRADEAITRFQAALKLQPGAALAHNNLALAFLQQGRADDAIAQYRSFLKLQPDHVQSLANLAWVLATWPDAALRNQAEAIELARRANQLSGGQDPFILRALAAVYADSGRFTEAVTTAETALRLADAGSNAALGEALRAQLKFYRAGFPVRDPAPKT